MANGFVDGVGGSDGRKVGGAVGDLDCLNESVFSDVGNIVGRKEGRKEGSNELSSEISTEEYYVSIKGPP
jgi:hypothetical protein